MSGFLAFLGRRAPLVLVASIAVSFVVPQLGAVLADGLRVIIVGLLTVAILRSDPAKVLNQGRRPVRLAVVVGGLMVVQPLVLLAVVFGLDALGLALAPTLVFGLLLVLAAPPIASAANFALIMGLDGALALGVTIAGLFLVPLSAPLLVALASPVELDAGGMFVAMVINLAIALLVAMALRRWLGAARLERSTDQLDGVMTIVMLLFIVAVMSDVGRLLAADWRAVAWLLAVSVIANFGVQAVTAGTAVGAGRLMGVRGATVTGSTVALLAGNRNFGFMVAALPAAAAEPLLAFLALYQIPMFATPLICGPLYRRAVAR